jgi:hypothetical protein
VNPLLAAAAEVQALCSGQGWRFCFIGGLAVIRWGEPRLTQDVDLTIIAGFGGEEPIVDALLGRLAPRRADAREFALRHRVVLVRAGSGVPIDIALGALPFEERAVNRASDYELAAGVTITTCSAEDLVVLKAFAGRDQDWLDIAGVAARQAGRLREDLIWTELLPLLELKEAPEAAGRLRAILDVAS